LDPPHAAADPATAVLNDRTPSLLDDVNIELISPSGKHFFPWSLDPKSPSSHAVNSKPNHVDNVERIDVPIASWEDGVWTLMISLGKAQSPSVAIATATTGFVNAQ
jgi:hypothetical protein